MTSRTPLAACAATLLCVALASGCHPRQGPDLVPPQNVRMDSEVLQDFYEEIQQYVQLRHKAVDVVPALAPNATADQISVRQKALTEVIVRYRRKAKPGDIFKPDVEAAFRHVFKEAFATPEGPAMIQEIRQGNPMLEGVPNPGDPTRETRKQVRLGVNAVYPADAPFSSVPSSLLSRIPALPPEVRYRFVGRALIVRDTDANVILDFIRDIVPDPSIPR